MEYQKWLVRVIIYDLVNQMGLLGVIFNQGNWRRTWGSDSC